MPSLETLTPEKSVSPNEAKDLRFNRHKTVIPNKVKDLRSNHHKSVILSKAKDLRLNPHKTVILNKSKDLRFNHHKSVIPKPTVSLGLANPPPILAGANDRNALDRMQIEKIAIDADQQGALARDGWPQHRHVFRIAADLDWQVGRRNDHRGSAKEAADPIHIFLRKPNF